MSKSRPTVFEKIKKLFNEAGDFGQRLQGIVWLIGLLVGGIVLLFGLQLSDVPEETKALVYFVALIFLFVITLLLVAYTIILHNRLSEQYNNLKKAADETALKILEVEYWKTLEQGSHGIDEVILSAYQNVDEDTKTRREDCISLLMSVCRQSILPLVDADQKRVAFLEYPRNGTNYTLVEGAGIAHETRNDIKKLTITSGVAARAQSIELPVYIEDITDEKSAREKGYIQVSTVARFRSIVCVSVGMNNTAIGVISADCKKPAAFSDADIQILERFSRKIRLIYALFLDT